MRTIDLDPMGKATAEIAKRSLASPYNDFEVNDHSAFWLGSVPMSDSSAVSRFLGLAKEARFEEMTRLASLSDAVAYGVLLRRSSGPGVYTVAVLVQSNEPNLAQPCLFAGTVTDINIIEKAASIPALPESMMKLRLRDVFRMIFRRGGD